ARPVWSTSRSVVSPASASTRSCGRSSGRRTDEGSCRRRGRICLRPLAPESLASPAARVSLRQNRRQHHGAMKIPVTGAAGFIGMHLALRLARDGADVTGVDNFDPYYDVALKRARADQLARAGVRCIELDLAEHAV